MAVLHVLDREDCAIGEKTDLKASLVAQAKEPEIVRARGSEQLYLRVGHGVIRLSRRDTEVNDLDMNAEPPRQFNNVTLSASGRLPR